ncbi:MAG: xanthine dehydrogenase molybdopterin binding subunit [Bacteroidota bacterium]
MNKQSGVVGASPNHLSGLGHVTGRSRFVGDEPAPHGMLHLKVLTSPVAHGTIKSLEFSEALKVPGVAGIYTYRDIPGVNQIGGIIQDEVLLAEHDVHFVGEAIAVVAADSRAAAWEALTKIKLEIEEHPAILTVDDALQAKAFVGPIRTIERGDIEQAFADADFVLEGIARNGGQEHFYLETQRSRCVIEEGGRLLLFSSTQNPSEIQRMAADVLGKPRVDVTVDVRRLGGGFGGKEAQATPWACMTALVTHLTGRPSELVLDREEDLRYTGKRHAYQSPWKIAFDKGGHILGYSVELNADCGAVADVSTSVLERAMLHAENAYHIPNVRVIGRPCRTNLPPATAYRGFGGPQGVYAIETAIDRMAHHLGLDPLEVRRRNLYQNGDKTPYGQVVKGCVLPEVLDRVEALSDWSERREAIKAFNQENRFLKKGLAVTPIKFGISFTAAFLNQGSALVNVYADGSVSVSHGAIEMGQEVDTKIGQIVSSELGIPLERIRVESNNTKRIANSSPTAASTGADLNGHAAEDAARQIAERLRALAARMLADPEQGIAIPPPFIRLSEGWAFDERNPERRISLTDLVGQAYFQRVDLGAHGFYATPGVEFNRESGKGNPFLYFVFGAAVSEVTVDLLTGQITVDEVSIVHDAGKSLNPTVDQGQVQGAFMQGMGWATFEELVRDERGRLLSDSPATYKIPTIGDLPKVFRIELLENLRNERGLKRSKAIGEPPFLYGESVFFAVVDALRSLGEVSLDLPATPEKVLRACKSHAREGLMV